MSFKKTIPQKPKLPTPQPVYCNINSPNDMNKYFGRSYYILVFKEIKDSELVLTLGSNLYTLRIPPHWKDVELLESGCNLELSSHSQSVIPVMRDTFAS